MTAAATPKPSYREPAETSSSLPPPRLWQREDAPVVAAVDGSASGAMAARTAISLARRLGAPAVFVYVRTRPVVDPGRAVLSASSWRRDSRGEASARGCARLSRAGGRGGQWRGARRPARPATGRVRAPPWRAGGRAGLAPAAVAQERLTRRDPRDGPPSPRCRRSGAGHCVRPGVPGAGVRR